MCARQTQAWAKSLGEPEEAQPEVLIDPSTGETCIPGNQAAIWIHPGYRGLMENAVEGNMMVGLANLHLLRRRLATA